jgi:hypothetical protein
MILMAWHELAGVDSRAIIDQLGVRKITRQKLELDSKSIDPLYVLAYLNSDVVKSVLSGVATSAIGGEIQPNDLRHISIPIPDDPDLIAYIANLARKASTIQKALLPIRSQGWEITEDIAIAPAEIPFGIATLSLDRARVKWNLVISNPTAKVNKLIRVNHRLFSGKQEVARIPATAPEEAMEWLRRQWLLFPDGTTVGDMELNNPLIRRPSTRSQSVRAVGK